MDRFVVPVSVLFFAWALVISLFQTDLYYPAAFVKLPFALLRDRSLHRSPRPS
ncbi:hypothetical protein P152DRAFT_462223, partial [Eremomyces bilateralis CBS 781.70]